jgi:methionyl-tRNA formyltransferase
MRIVLWGKSHRGTSCLAALLEPGYRPEAVVVHPRVAGKGDVVAEAGAEAGLEVLAPENPNGAEFESQLRKYEADLFVLAGYGLILRQNIIDVPRLGCLNLHAGKLPERRGSSPLNWALICGETSFTLSVIRIDAGVDSGDVVVERSFPIGPNDTIRELHAVANDQFPQMVLEAIGQLEAGTCRPRGQDAERAAYWPLRFPDDGLVLWDMLTAEQVHNRVRALAEPYPCAFTFFKGRKVKLLSSELHEGVHYGEAGRVYRKTGRGLLVCAADRCLWITDARFEDDGRALAEAVERYEKLATVRDAAVAALTSRGPR